MTAHTGHAALIVNPRLRGYRHHGHGRTAELEIDVQAEARKAAKHVATATLILPVRLNDSPSVRGPMTHSSVVPHTITGL